MLIAAGERFRPAIAAAPINEVVESVPWKMIHDLSEFELPGVPS
ncbi:MAG: hypothetical protein OXI66_08785 [Boseongicola sp.]|nr:hypothetical protein [Boseongicola sp.]